VESQIGNKRKLQRVLQWVSGVLIVLSLIYMSNSRLGHRLPRAVQDTAFMILVSLPFLLTGISWWRFVRAWRTDQRMAVWRIWISLCGCVALSIALLIPFFTIVFTLDWSTTAIWCLVASGVALFTGILAAKPLRLPLFLGGLVMTGLIVVIPVAVL